MKKHDKKALTTLIGATVVGSLASLSAGAAENPFAMKDLASGYVVAEGEQAPKAKEMTCGEGKCGAQMMKQPEMKCGSGMKAEDKAKTEKAIEGKCAAGMKMDAAPSAAPAAK